MKKSLWLILMFLAVIKVNGQHIRPLKDVTGNLDANELRLIAERLYHEYHYFAALEYYDRLGNESELRNSDLLNLARIKFVLRDYQGATLLYEKLVSENSNAEISFYLGDLYKILDQPIRARRAYSDVVDNAASTSELKNRARYQFENLALLDRIQNSSDKNVSLEPDFSNSGIRSARFIGDNEKIVDVEVDLKVKKKIKINSDLTVELDTVLIHRLHHKKGGRLDKIRIPLKNPSVSLSNASKGLTSNQLLFEVCDAISSKPLCAIHSSGFNGGRWSEPSRISSRINMPGYSSKDPLMVRTEAGELFLFFSSNRPGGFGGYDIWMSQYVQGQYAVPINLGAGVNTPEDERAPFFDASTGYLFFSSNGHAGLGGMDIFLTRVNWGKGRGQTFNVGKPYNTSYDDLYFNLRSDGKKGILASNRDESCCNQTYEFELVTPFSHSQLPDHFVEVNAFDQFDSELMVLRQSFNYEELAFNETQTEFILSEDADLEGILIKDEGATPNRKILLVDNNGEVVSSTISDGQGRFRFRQLPSGGQYSFIMAQNEPGLIINIKLVNATGDVFGRLNNKETPGIFRYRPLEDYLAGVWRLEVEDATISGELTNNSVKGEKILLVDEEGRIVAAAQTDKRGKFSFRNLPAGKKYAFVLRAAETPMDVNVDIIDELGNVVESFSSSTSKELFKYRVLEDYQAGVWKLNSKDGSISGSLVAGTLAIGNKKVLLMDENGKVLGVSYTDKKGVFTFRELPTKSKLFFVIEESETEFNIDVAVFDEDGNIITRFSSNNRQEVFKYNSLKKYEGGLYTLSFGDAFFKGSISQTGLALAGRFLVLADEYGEVLKLVETDFNGNFEINGLEVNRKYRFILPLRDKDKKVEIKVVRSTNKVIDVLDNQLNSELFHYQDLSDLIDTYYGEHSKICGQFESIETEFEVIILLDAEGREVACAETTGRGYFQIDDVPFNKDYRFILDGCSLEDQWEIEIVNAIGATTLFIDSKSDKEFVQYRDLNLSSSDLGLQSLSAGLNGHNSVCIDFGNFTLARS